MATGKESLIEKRQAVAKNVTRPKRKVTLSFAHNTNSIGPVLHIHNGDSAAQTALKSDLAGEHLAWREALVCGPTPGNLSAENFRRVRAKHLADAYAIDLSQCEKSLGKQEEALAKFADHEEVVLWFEHDLFCQVHLIYLLNWFAGQELGRTRLSMICISEFRGVKDFRGLGQLNEAQLRSLFPERREVFKTQLELGILAWDAYSSADPSKIERLLKTDSSALPFLRNALLKHLERFPSVRNGLGRVENVGLELIGNGDAEFKTLFPEFGNWEPSYGFGDAQFYLELKRLVNASHPLVGMKHDGISNPSDPDKFLSTSFQITDQGRRVLSGDEDFVRLNGIDLWLGGVHLEGDEAAWRWDEAEDRLRRV